MIAKQRIWDVKEYNKEKAGCLATELGVSPLVTGILLERGFTDIQSMRDFLYGSEKPFHDPFLMQDMQRTVERVLLALERGEKITVYGDYDVDGITASSLLYIYLKRRGAQVETYIPRRKSEGYGLNDEALKTIAESGTTLVITVDCGISGLHEVERAPRELDIIITDHHTVPEQLPPAYAIVNPKQQNCQYPFKDLSGVGVAFKLCQALEQGEPGQLPEWEELTELAALGTVADIVPLLGENREIVRRGLQAMQNTSLVGLQALIQASSCTHTVIDSERIGFGLAPRLNAVGRLEHAQSAVELLVTDDAQKAARIADELNRENALRQEISRKIMEEAEAQLAQEEHIDTAIVLANTGWHQGVIGIVASRLVEKYHLPTILISIDNDMAKGSCRSIPALNLYEAIAAESDLLTQFGGHHQAAGLTLPAAKVPEFRRRFREQVRRMLRPEDFILHQTVDCVIGARGEISLRDLEELSLLEPCGCCNTPPVFAFQNARLHNARTMGKDNSHLQFTLDKGDFSYRCVMWHQAEILPFLYENMIADVAFQPRVNIWNNETSVQLHAAGIVQQLSVGDYRQSTEDKYKMLAGLAQVHNGLDVYVQRGSSLPQEYAAYVKQFTYAELEAGQDGGAAATAVLLEVPFTPLKEILSALKARGVKNVYLLFQAREAHALEQDLFVHYPNREVMEAVYKAVMNELREQYSVSAAALLQKYASFMSEEALQIMAELNFIRLEHDIITKGMIRRCKLEESPLYVRLQQECRRLVNSFQENLRVSQYELLRCQGS